MPYSYAVSSASRRAQLLASVALIAGFGTAAPALAQIEPSTCPSDHSDSDLCFSGTHANDSIVESSSGAAGEGDNGTGQSGDDWHIYSDAVITTSTGTGIRSPIIVESEGGAGSTDTPPGNGGEGGAITLTNDGALSWSGGSQNGLNMINATSAGGAGGHPDRHDSGGVGGDSGQVTVNNTGDIQVQGVDSYDGDVVVGIRASTSGGDGGDANDAVINHHGGDGGDADSIMITNSGAITLGEDDDGLLCPLNVSAPMVGGIMVRSLGGDGGANGFSNNTNPESEHRGNGGDGTGLEVDNSGEILIVSAIPNGNTQVTGISAVLQGGDGSDSAHNFESGGNGGFAIPAGDATSTAIVVNNDANITVIANGADGGGGIVARGFGGAGGVGNKEDDSGNGNGGRGGFGGIVSVNHSGEATITTQGDQLTGILAQSRGGAGGSGGSGYEEDNSSGGTGGDGGNIDVSLTGQASISTSGREAPGILAQSIGGIGGDGGNDTGVIGSDGGPGVGGSTGEVSVAGDNAGSIATKGDFSPGIAAQSIGGGGGTGADFIGVLGGQGGDGGRGGDSNEVIVISDGKVTTEGDHSYGILAQSIGGAGGAGGVSDGLIYTFGGDGGAGGAANTVEITNNEGGTVSTKGYGSHAIVAQSIAGGGGAGGTAGGFLAVGGAGGSDEMADGSSVTVGQHGSVSTAGDAAIGVLAQSIGGGGGSGAGAKGIISVGGRGELGGRGGSVEVDATGGADSSKINTDGAFSHAIVAQSIGGGGGHGGDVLDFSVGIPTAGIGGTAGGGNDAGATTVNFDSAIQTHGNHSSGILAQAIGGGGGNGGNASGYSAGSIVSLDIGGGGGGGGDGGTVDVTATGGSITTDGHHSSGMVAQSIGGGGGNGGNAFGAAANVDFGAALALGGKSGGGGDSEAVSVDLTNTAIVTGSALYNHVKNNPADKPLPLHGRATDSYGIVAQSIGGGGGNGGSATADQVVAVIPVNEDAPDIAVSAAIGGVGGAGGDGNGTAVSLDNSQVTTFGSGGHAILAQTIGGGGGTGGDATSLSIMAGLKSPSPQVNAAISLGGSGGNGGDACDADCVVTVELKNATIGTYGDNANGVLTQSIGGGGGDGGAGSSDRLELEVGGVGDEGEEESGPSVALDLSLGGSGGGGGDGGQVTATLDSTSKIQTVGSGSRGIVAQSIGGGGGTSQGGTAALNSGGFKGTVQVGLTGGSGGDADDVSATNAGTITTLGDDADGLVAQSIGGGGGIGGSVGDDGSADHPNWVDIVKDVKHEEKELGDGKTNYSMTVSLGGQGGSGGSPSTVTVTNSGTVMTTGDWADGILAQSIGGGGGIGGTAVASGTQATASVDIGIGGTGGASSDGGQVQIDQVGTITTQGYASFGLLAQSIGGGGGQGGHGGSKANGHITIGGGQGGQGGVGGDGDLVAVTGGGNVATSGDDAHGVVLQSIGGGGGIGGMGTGESSIDDISQDIAVGGSGGTASDGGKVELTIDKSDSLNIQTAGDRAFGLVAQSIGGGGGIGGAGAGATIDSIAISGGQGNGGEVSLSIQAGSDSNTQTSSLIHTTGDGAHGIVAQSIGGGGGIAGDVSSGKLSFDGPGDKGYYNGDDVSVNLGRATKVVTEGDFAFGILAQSIGGGGGIGGDKNGAFIGSNGSATGSAGSGNVDITADGLVQAKGNDSIGIFAQSDAEGTGGTDTITIDVSGTVIGGSGDKGAAVHIDEGIYGNTLTVEEGGSIIAAGGSDGTAIRYTGGADLRVFNKGTITGGRSSNIAGDILLRNDAGKLGRVDNSGVIYAGKLLDADVQNDGNLRVGDTAGKLGTTRIGGDFTQSTDGTLAVDADLATGAADLLTVDGKATLAGKVGLHFSSLLPGGEAQIVAANGGMSGQLAPAGSGLFDLELTHEGDAVSVRVNDAHLSALELNDNRTATVGHLQDIWDLGATPELGKLFAALENAALVSKHGSVFDAVSPGVALAPGALSRSAMQDFTGSLMSCPFFEGGGSLLGETTCGWARVTGTSTSQSEGAGIGGFDTSGVTYQLGGQVEFAPDWFLGGSLAYVHNQVDDDTNRVSSDGDSVYVGLSAKHQKGPWLFAAALGGGYGSYDTDRFISVPGIENVARSSPEVYSLGGRLRAAYTFSHDNWYLRPIADVELLYVNMPGYSETGTGVLGLDHDDVDQLTLALSPAIEVGGRVSLSQSVTLRPFLRAGVSFLSNDDWKGSTRLQGAPDGTGFFETSLPTDDVIGRVSAGMQLMATNGIDVQLAYDGQFSEHVTTHAGSLKASLRF